VLATGEFVGEGFHDARLDARFLAMPVSWKGTLVQYVGRLYRRHHAKQEVRVMDYVDRDVPMLAKMFEKRMRGYRAMGHATAVQDQSRAPDADGPVAESSCHNIAAPRTPLLSPKRGGTMRVASPSEKTYAAIRGGKLR